MSKTQRKGNYSDYYPYRRPKTFNEIKQLETLLHDNEVELRNRDKAKIHNLPTVYDDIVKSGYYEDYDWKHHWDKDSQSQGESQTPCATCRGGTLKEHSAQKVLY